MKSNKFQKFELILGRILLSTLFLIFLLVLIDRASTLFFSSKSLIEKHFPGSIYRYPKPYVMFGGLPNNNNLNELGYIGKAPSINKKNEYRIIMLGGSTVLNGNPPISELLEKTFIRNGFSNVRIYNFGVLSSVSSMELARIVFEIPKYKPDLIILYNGGNDITQPYGWDPRPGYPFNFIVYENNPILESNIKKYPTLTLLTYGSNILRFMIPKYFYKKLINLEELNKKTNKKSKEWEDKIVAIYVENSLKSKIISNAFGSNVFVFFQPMLFYKDSINQNENFVNSHFELKDLCLRAREKILYLMDSYKSQGLINFADLSDIYDNDINSVFTDFIHTYQEKKQIIADAMFNNLKDIVPK